MGLPITTVNLALRTATVSRAGFGTPIFISAHNSFVERARSYASLSAVGEDFSTAHPAYIAAQGVFASTPSVPAFKIGRRVTTSNSLIPENVVAGSTHSVTVTVDDGNVVTAAYVASGGDTELEVATALASAINGDAPVAAKITATVVGTGAAAVVQIVKVGAEDAYAVTGLINLGESFVTVESAPDALSAITAEDNDFYFILADDHTEVFVLAMAGAVQASEKQYFVSSQETGSINTAYSVAATDLLAKIKQAAYTRTAYMWDETADTAYPECNFVGQNAPYSPDTNAVVWDGLKLAGVDVAKNTLGNQITSTQQNNLIARNASFVIGTGAGNRLLGGKVASGEWIDNIRTLDNIAARVREDQDAKVMNQAGKKIGGGKEGVATLENVLQGSLNPFVASNALSSYSTGTSKASIDTGTRTLSGMEFTAFLKGAIIRVIIDGSLQNQET